MWNMVCIKDWGKSWRVGEGFAAHRCEEVVRRDGSRWWKGVDIDGKSFCLRQSHFKRVPFE
jgi:hypothetical protein